MPITNKSILPHVSFVLFILFFISTFSSSVFAVDNPCDPDFVSIRANGGFFVSPSMDTSGVTDTSNLQCVHNAIENQSFHAVKLNSGNFYIKEVTLNCPPSKACTFAGSTRSGTIVDVVDDSIDCQGSFDNNVVPGGLRFRGTVLVQFFTIRGDSPCMTDRVLPGLLVFTGKPAVVGNECENSVLFGNLNRVDVIAHSWDVDAGVLVTPQGRYIYEGVCQDGLSGSFTSTRTYVDGPWFGILASMHAGARLGIDFFESVNSRVGIEILDSNAITAVNFCRITGTAAANSDFQGVAVTRFESSPNTTTTSVNKCTFDISSDPEAFGAIGVNVQDYGPPANMLTVVSSNIFNLMGTATFGMEFGDVSNCTATANTFSGNVGFGITIFAYGASPSGCTVTANKGFAGTSVFNVHIYASPGTFDNVLGLHPGASVLDDGCNFDLNAPGGGCALGGGDPFKNSVSAKSPESVASGQRGHGRSRAIGYRTKSGYTLSKRNNSQITD